MKTLLGGRARRLRDLVKLNNFPGGQRIPGYVRLRPRLKYLVSAVSLCLWIGQAGCQNSVPMPSNIGSVKRDASEKIVAITIEKCSRGDAKAIANWLEHQPKELQSLMIDSCEFSDELTDAFGDLGALRKLEIVNSNGWLERLSEAAPKVENIWISSPALHQVTLTALQEFEALRELGLVSRSDEMEFLDMRLENLDFLSGVPLQRVQIIARSIVIQSEKVPQGLESIERLTVTADGDASDVIAFAGQSPILSFHWSRAISENCETPLAKRFSKAGNWSQLKRLNLLVNHLPANSKACESPCPDSIKMRLDGNFAEGLREAQQVRRITLSHVVLTEEVWVALGNLPQLTSLDIYCSDAADSELKHLLRSPTLSFLGFTRGNVDVSEKMKTDLEQKVDVVAWSENATSSLKSSR